MRIAEIFVSIQGEGPSTGSPCSFVRLAGCNLRCRGMPCDTSYAWRRGSGEELSAEQLLRRIPDWPPYVTWTGGEPLLQAGEVINCSQHLSSRDWPQDLFTNGSLPFPPDLMSIPNLRIIMDWKLGSSGELGRSLAANVSLLRPTDVLKFVIGARSDLDEASTLVTSGACAASVVMSPVVRRGQGGTNYGMEPSQIVDWLIASQINARLGLQVHKQVWPGDLRGR